MTSEEKEAVILEARKQKFAREEQDKYNREYWEKLTAQSTAKNYTATELRNKLLLSRSAIGKRFEIDNDNVAQVNTLCLYFSGDPKLLEYGFSPDKGILLMGGLGVGKSHLMSFFFQNQKASYVMTPCRQIEDRWANTNMKDEQPTNWIEHYSNLIQGSINSNPFNHQKLGVCLDDLGTETIPSKRFGEEKNVLSEIILARYERGLYNTTHITTNLNMDKISALYGDRIVDRLVEMCNVVTFSNAARSRRL